MTYHATQRIVIPSHTNTPSLSLDSEIHYSRDTSCPDACSASPSSATRIYGHVQLSCSPYTLPDWAVRCLFIHQKVLSGSFFITAISQKRHFVDLHLSTFALEQEETWVERPEGTDLFGLQLSSPVPLSFPLSSPSLIILPLLQSKHPQTKTSLSLIPIPILSIQFQISNFKNSIHQPPHPQPRTNHTRPHDSNFSRKHPKPRPRTYYRPRLFSELLHS